MEYNPDECDCLTKAGVCDDCRALLARARQRQMQRHVTYRSKIKLQRTVSEYATNGAFKIKAMVQFGESILVDSIEYPQQNWRVLSVRVGGCNYPRAPHEFMGTEASVHLFAGDMIMFELEGDERSPQDFKVVVHGRTFAT